MTEPALSRLARWACELGLDAVPEAAREQAKNQVLSTLAAVHAGWASDLGPPLTEAFPPPRGTVILPACGRRTTPQHAAFLAAAYSMVLDFDDTMLGGHVCHSSVLVPYCYGQALGRSGSEVLCAQIVANELAARIGAATALGPLRGQMAAHVHLVAAAAARARLEGLSPPLLAEAAGFALTYPPRPLYPGFLGSDAKALCAAWPLRTGLEAVDAVRAGLRGNPAVLDDPRGFLHTFSDVPLPQFLGGLGTRWHTETASFKVHPGCAYVSAAIDATLTLVRRHDLRPEEVESVDVHASVFTASMDRHSSPYLRGPESALATLSFSTPYNVACAILHRELSPSHLRRERIADPRIWDLARRVRVHHDPELTVRALLSDLPIGAALKAAGPQALRYVLRTRRGQGVGGGRGVALAARLARALGTSAGGPPDTSRARKAVGARVAIRTTDGRLFEEEVAVAVGSAGSGDWKMLREAVWDKFLRCAAPVVGPRRAAEAAELITGLEHLDPSGLRRLAALNAPAPGRPASSTRAGPPAKGRGGSAG